MLRGDIKLRVRDICRQVCAENGVDIIRGVLSNDHVHMFVSVPPKLAISDLMRLMKGRSSHKVQREFPHLNKSIEAFEEIANELKRIRNSNTLRHSDQCMYAQATLTMMAKRFHHMMLKDPRTRGSENLEFIDGHGLVDKSGHAELLAREDLNEPVKINPDRWSGPSPI